MGCRRLVGICILSTYVCLGICYLLATVFPICLSCFPFQFSCRVAIATLQGAFLQLRQNVNSSNFSQCSQRAVFYISKYAGDNTEQIHILQSQLPCINLSPGPHLSTLVLSGRAQRFLSPLISTLRAILLSDFVIKLVKLMYFEYGLDLRPL